MAKRTPMNDIEPMTIQVNAALVTEALRLFEAPAIDINDPQQVADRIREYFNECITAGLRPGNMGLYAALGMSRQDYNNYVTGKSRKVNPECIDIVKKATRSLSAYREFLANSGRLNPVTYIFMGKNYDGMTDQTQLEVLRTDQTEAHLSPEEIARQIEQDIPVDIETDSADSALIEEER